ncbi:hypothetical protein FVEG_04322 [Fusarium verticillioides 7600]|uniref:Mid2 domain-containing protein n=1 Tax=Gibberella moniliformis (strain M3125 / FGSC 7600) TaxID=334819 RepID=W7MCI7_GIBM7|nr:hypothetical protein FVEG_04322 [Fusarium verticillioides 7600]EWG42547.1 hypothetical protein FVEG_04322 [Fusarium verticillioides 7600]
MAKNYLYTFVPRAKSIKVTTGSTTGDQILTHFDTTRGIAIVTKTAEPSPEQGSLPQVGAIVGGVIGGVALIVILGLAFWFLRNRKPQNKEVATAPALSSGISSQQYQDQPYKTIARLRVAR